MFLAFSKHWGKTLLVLLAVIAAVAYLEWDRIWKSVVKGSNEDNKTFVLSNKEPLKFYTWPDYFSVEIIQEFSDQTGIGVELEIFNSNEEMLDNIQKEENKYDLILPAGYMVSRMKELKLLQHIDYSKIPNYKNIDRATLKKDYDRASRFSVPYYWGTIGIAYNREFVDDMPLSWSHILEPESIEYLAGHVYMIDDMRISIGTALIYLGYSPQSTNPKEIEKATELLMKQKPYLMHDEDKDPIEELINGEILLGQVYSGEASFAMEENPNIRFILPGEGIEYFIDNLAIPVETDRQEDVHELINFLLDNEIAARMTNYSRYANSCRNAKRYVDRKILNSAPYFFPFLSPNAYMLKNLPPETLDIYEEFWAKLVGVSTYDLQNRPIQVGESGRIQEQFLD